MKNGVIVKSERWAGAGRKLPPVSETSEALEPSQARWGWCGSSCPIEGSRTCCEEGGGEASPETATPRARPAVRRRAWSPSEPETSELREAMWRHSKMERWSPSSGGVESLGADCGSGGGWVCVLLHLITTLLLVYQKNVAQAVCEVHGSPNIEGARNECSETQS